MKKLLCKAQARGLLERLKDFHLHATYHYEKNLFPRDELEYIWFRHKFNLRRYVMLLVFVMEKIGSYLQFVDYDVHHFFRDLFKGLAVKPKVWFAITKYILHGSDGLTMQILSALGTRHLLDHKLGPKFDYLAFFLKTFYFSFANLNDDALRQVLSWKSVNDVPFQVFTFDNCNSFFGFNIFDGQYHLNCFIQAYCVGSEQNLLSTICNAKDESASDIFSALLNHKLGHPVGYFDAFVLLRLICIKLWSHPESVLPQGILNYCFPPTTAYGDLGFQITPVEDFSNSLASTFGNFRTLLPFLPETETIIIFNILLNNYETRPFDDMTLKFARLPDETACDLDVFRISDLRKTINLHKALARTCFSSAKDPDEVLSKIQLAPENKFFDVCQDFGRIPACFEQVHSAYFVWKDLWQCPVAFLLQTHSSVSFVFMKFSTLKLFSVT